MDIRLNNFVCKHDKELFESGYTGCEENCEECDSYNNCCGCIGEQRSVPGEVRFEACRYCEIGST